MARSLASRLDRLERLADLVLNAQQAMPRLARLMAGAGDGGVQTGSGDNQGQ